MVMKEGFLFRRLKKKSRGKSSSYLDRLLQPIKEADLRNVFVSIYVHTPSPSRKIKIENTFFKKLIFQAYASEKPPFSFLKIKK